MPVEIGETINHFADMFLRAPIVHSVANNPIYTALMIVFIVILIILFVFRDANTEESLLVTALRAGFWIFLMLLGVLFLHNKVLSMETETETKNTAYDGVFTGAYGGSNIPGKVSSVILEDSIVPVRINTDFAT